MSEYIDGFVLPLAKDKVEIYKEVSNGAGNIWVEHGALEYRECMLEDAAAHDMIPFPKIANAGENDTVVFAWILYKSRAHRDEVNAKVMADPRLHEQMEKYGCPVDCKTMAYGGFETIVKV